MATITGGRILGPAGEVGGGRWDLLCLWCIDALAAEKSLRFDVALHFSGRAITGTSQSSADREHITRICEQRDVAEREAATLRKERDLAKRLVSRLPMCPDHRDKFSPEQCQACEAERLRERLARIKTIIATYDAFDAVGHISEVLAAEEEPR